MPKFVDITGKKFGRLTVLSRAENLKDRTNWNCVCDCGNTRTARGSNLIAGRTLSCGCLQKESAKRRLIKHGRSYKNNDGSYEYAREGHLLRKYGIKLTEYNKLLLEQSNKCAICGYEFGQVQGDTYVDHCHSTGGVRGLLCRACNAGIGQLKDSVDLLHKAITYLERNK